MEGEGCLLTLSYPDLLFLNGPTHALSQSSWGSFLWPQLMLSWPRQVVTPEAPDPPS